MAGKLLVVLLISSCFSVFGQKQKSKISQEIYYPGIDAEWKKKTPAEAGMDAVKLQDAIAYSISRESKNPRDLQVSHYQTFGKEPYGYGIGPFKERGDVTGIVIRNGYIIAEWGDPYRVDMTHSVTKSFLSTVIGVAVDRGLIRNVNDTVWKYVPPILPYQSLQVADKAGAINSIAMAHSV